MPNKAANQASISNTSATEVIRRFDLRVESRPIKDIKPYQGNARQHDQKQIDQIAASIRQFGFNNPVLIDQEGTIIAGHGRIEAARSLGWDCVPTILIDHLSEAEKRAYVLADNRLAELAGWDRETLAIELQGLLELELDFDIEITGFETPEIDLLLESEEGEATDPADQLPETDESAEPVTRTGDLWQLGDHRLLCGNALKQASYERLLGSDRAQMVFADPPYNVPIEGNVCGTGSIHHREFAMASGEMSSAEFTAFLRQVFQNLVTFSADGSIHDICMDWRHMRELLDAGKETYTELKNVCVWNKDNAGLGAFYRSKHEMVFVFKSGTGRHINNFGLGEHGRHRTNIWDYAGVNSLRKGRLEELAMHPTVKPVAMVADAIRDCSHRKGVILDPFAGSGTTIIAAAKTGRIACAMEIDPAYVDVAIRRWQTWSGESAVLVGIDQTFDAIAQERANSTSVSAGGIPVRHRVRRRTDA